MTLEERWGSETWKDVPGYEGLYQVSNLGRVRSNERNGNMNKCNNRILILKPSKFSGGYLGVGLHKDGNSNSRLVHRIVAEVFVPNPKKFQQVNHKDGDKENNIAENLEWVSPSYNSWHRNHILGVKPWNTTPIMCIETGEKFESFNDAHKKTGVNQISLQRFFKGKYKTAGGATWKKI